MKRTNMFTYDQGNAYRVFQDTDGRLYYRAHGHLNGTFPEYCIEEQTNKEKENTNMKTAEEMITITKEQYEIAIRTYATQNYLYDLSCKDTEWEPDEGLRKAALRANEEAELYYELLRKFGLSSKELDELYYHGSDIISEVIRKFKEANK